MDCIRIVLIFCIITVSYTHLDVYKRQEFLVATGLPFNILVGCDMLRRNSAIIDLRTEKLSLFTNGQTWTADLVGSDRIIPSDVHQQIRRINYINNNPMIERIMDDNANEDLWSQKIQDIRDFRSGITGERLPTHQADKLITIYEQYRSVFSDEPGKVKNFQCTLQFRDTDVYKRQVTSSNDFGPQTCNKSNRKWKSSMSFGDTTYMRVMILSPTRLLFFHFFWESSHT